MDRETFELLQEADWKTIGEKLVAFAEDRAWGYGWRHGGDLNLAAGQTAEDIAQEVIARTIQGVRKWDPEKGPLVPWLCDQVKSLVDHLYQSKFHRYERRTPTTDSGEELSDQIEYRLTQTRALFPAAPATPEQIMLKKEEIEYRERILFESVDGDSELEDLLEVVMNGCEPKARYIAAELDVPAKDIYNQLRRLRRRISRLMQGGDS